MQSMCGEYAFSMALPVQQQHLDDRVGVCLGKGPSGPSLILPQMSRLQCEPMLYFL